jgi:hypothetical protein
MEAFLYQLIPLLQTQWDNAIPQNIYMGLYSVMTWVSYSFALPTALVMSLYFYGLNNTNPKGLYVVKSTVWLPALGLTFISYPIHFSTYQAQNHMFWVVYSVYNVGIGAAVLFFVLKGITAEKSEAIKRQKILLGAGVMPPTVYVLITTYIFHVLQLERWYKAWQWNVVIILFSLTAAVVMAFKNGFIGLKFTTEVYKWDSEINAFGMGVDYASHMLKNQTSKMEICIENLKQQLTSPNGGVVPEEIAILSRSISTLKDYIGRMKRHSQHIILYEEPCRLTEMIGAAMPPLLTDNENITIHTDIKGNIFWECDKNHMTEMFRQAIKFRA